MCRQQVVGREAMVGAGRAHYVGQERGEEGSHGQDDAGQAGGTGDHREPSSSLVASVSARTAQSKGIMPECPLSENP
jgi:hypothetical protein